MKRSLPSLTALRSFEAVARHLSFTKAADELFVTQAAVSHQVKSLSEQLGIKLFRRGPYGIALTEEGAELYEVTRESFDRIADAVGELKPTEDPQSAQLVVLVTPGFSRHWLAPRIADFLARHPSIALVLHHSQSPVEAAFDRCHIAISHVDGRWPGLSSHELTTEQLVPLCSPALLKALSHRPVPNDLEQMILICETVADWWSDWLHNACVPTLRPRHRVFTDDPNFAIEAGLRGEGVFIESTNYMRRYIENGSLVEPFDHGFAVQLRYNLVYPMRAAKDRKIKAFRDWILEQVQVMA